MGIARAKELIFTSRRVSGEEAVRLGVASYCEPDAAQAEARAWQIIEEVLANGPIGVRMAKAAINAGADSDLKTGLEVERLAYYRVIHSEDRTEGMKSFIEKRNPVYKNK